MPGSAIADWMLQPILEAILQVFGYMTACVVVPVLSLGRIAIEHDGRPRRARPRWHGFHRAEAGGYVIDADMASLLGLLFWVAVGIAAYFLLR